MTKTIVPNKSATIKTNLKIAKTEVAMTKPQ